MPFEKLVEVLNPERVLNRHPLFEVLFNYIGISRASLDLSGLSIERVKYESFQAKFPMTLYLEEISGGLMLRLAYQTALFLPERIGHIVDQFHHLLRQIAANPDAPIQAYSLVTEPAGRLLPDPTISLLEPEQLPVPRQFISMAETEPAPDCFTAARRRVDLSTAGNLRRENCQSADGPGGATRGRRRYQWAMLLWSNFRDHGRFDRTRSCADARLFAALCATGPDAPDRLGRTLVAGWRHRKRDGGMERGFQSLPLTRISCEGECAEAQSGPVFEGIISAQPEDPAYVFFTSGTTGVPKGILGTHKGLSHFLQWERQILSVSSGDRVAQLTGLSFDVVLRDIFLPLTSGATLCLPDSASASPVDSVVPWLLRERITILHTVPSLANAWLEGLESPMPLPDLRWVLFAGEPLAAALVHRWRERMGTAGGIFNLYGPTETTLAKCAYRVPLDPSPGVQPIGSPLPETQALIINQANQLCGIGEPGEIVIRTPFRTLGYLNVSPKVPTGIFSQSILRRSSRYPLSHRRLRFL